MLSTGIQLAIGAGAVVMGEAGVLQHWLSCKTKRSRRRSFISTSAAGPTTQTSYITWVQQPQPWMATATTGGIEQQAPQPVENRRAPATGFGNQSHRRTHCHHKQTVCTVAVPVGVTAATKTVVCTADVHTSLRTPRAATFAKLSTANASCLETARLSYDRPEIRREALTGPNSRAELSAPDWITQLAGEEKRHGTGTARSSPAQQTRSLAL